MRNKLMSITVIVALLFSMLSSVAIESASADSTSSLEVAATRNVALHAQATTSGECNVSENGSMAVDGRTDTKWCDSSSSQKKWLQLDLGQAYNMNEWVVQSAAIGESSSRPFRNTKDFRLQISEDGDTWVDIDEVKDNVQTIVKRYLPTFTARYVRLFIDKGAHDSNTVRIYEFELYGVESNKLPVYPATNLEPVDYVDPFINTLGDNGQTNPGPKTPFGLVSLGPDGDGGAFSGYYYEDKHLKGFSHLRFSGVGCSGGGGNILMMPQVQTFTKDSNQYKTKYDKNSEEASVGYYSTELESGIKAELTASDHVGFHRYTFPASETDGSVLIDLSNSYGGMVDANLKVENNNEISGMVKSRNVCGHGHYTMYYSIQFDHDFNSYTSWTDNAIGASSERSGSNSGVWVDFNTAGSKVIQAKVGLSTISVEQAKYERDHDITNWDFDGQHAKTRSVWSELLNRVQITDNDEDNKTIFYTQLYHSFLHPNNVTSSDGTFRAGRDEETIRHTSEIGDDFEYYNGWSTWDDFRKYSLYSLLDPQRYKNMVLSMVDLYETRGSYSQWGSGYWPSPTVRNEFNGTVILDAVAKGLVPEDLDLYAVLQGMAVDTDNYSVNEGEISGKLEKAFSAYYPMKLAEMLGDKQTYDHYRAIAMSYKNLWNPDQVDESNNKRGFFTPNASTVNAGDITQVNKYAYQGNLWTYRWFVPHDIHGLASLIGSKREMAKDLQYFFKIDEYVAINEPDLHVPFLFNYLGMPYLTQYYAREYTTEVVTQKYHNHGLYSYPMKSRVYRNDPEGYLQSMDDDAGAMSSWFVYSAMGLFPGNPGDPYYLIGSPIFSETKLNLDGGKSFIIKANNVSSQNRFIQSATLNGQTFDQSWISYEDLMAGGVLEFEMSSQPNYSWGASSKAAPPTTDFSLNINNLLEQESLIAEQAEWKYDDHGQQAGVGWTSVAYDDSEWAKGAAILGYGGPSGSVNTTVSYGPSSGSKYPTTYFRHTFEINDIEDILMLNAGLIFDDGAIVYLNGHEMIRTNLPSGAVNYSTYANGTVNNERNWNGYRIDPAYLVEGTNIVSAEVHQVNATSSDLAFAFKLDAMYQLSEPKAPSEPFVDDQANTMGWKFVAEFNEASDYEYSVDSGQSWNSAVSNPQPVGSLHYEAGHVQVRVKANEHLKQAAGVALVSDQVFKGGIGLRDEFNLDIEVERSGHLAVEVTGTPKGNYDDDAIVVFQVMTDNEQAWMYNTVPVDNAGFQLTQILNVSASKYRVNIYLTDEFNGNIYDSVWLAEPFELKAEPAPNRLSEEDPLIDPLPVPIKEVELPVEEDPLTVEFENRTAWTDDAHPSNNDKLKTESGNGGTVVANTFNGAWLAYEVDLGSESVNRIAIEYDAPTSRVPADSLLEIRLGSVDGAIIGTATLPNTGSGWGMYTTIEAQLTTTLTGTQHLYFIMRGTTDSTRLYIGNFDRFTLSYQAIRSDFSHLELESLDAWSTELNPANAGPLKTENGKSGQQVANTFDGAWLAYKSMDFGNVGVDQFSIEYSGNSTSTAADSAVEIRLGGVNGTLVGTVAAPPTASGWGTYKTVTTSLTQTITGIQDVYLVFRGTMTSTYRYIGNFDNASFSVYVEPDPDPTPGSEVTIEFENRSAWSDDVNTFNNNKLKTESNNGGTVVGNTFTGAWLAYSNVDFGAEGKNRIAVEYDAPTSRAPADGRIEVRLGSLGGQLVGTVPLPNTGSGWGTYKIAEADLLTTVTVTQDVYLIMLGSTDNTRLYMGNFDRFTWSYEETRSDFSNLELESYDAWSTELNPINNNPLKTENGKSAQQVANTFNDAWLAYERMDFGLVGVDQFSIEYVGNSSNTAADSAVEIRLGGVDGTLIGTVATPPTGSNWGTYKTVTTSLTQTVTGIQDVYLVLKGTMTSTYRYMGNFDNASFSVYVAPDPGPTPESEVTIEFENRSEWSDDVNTFNNNKLKTESNNGGTVVGNTFTGAWLAYNNVDFGVEGKNRIAVEYDAPTSRAPADSMLEVRLDSIDGQLIGIVALPNTGSGWGTYTLAEADLTTTITGVQNLYLIMQGTTDNTRLYIGNLDRFILSYE